MHVRHHALDVLKKSSQARKQYQKNATPTLQRCTHHEHVNKGAQSHRLGVIGPARTLDRDNGLGLV